MDSPRIGDLPSDHCITIKFENTVIIRAAWSISAALEKLFWNQYSYEADL